MSLAAIVFLISLSLMATPAQSQIQADFEVRASIVAGCIVDGRGASGNMGQIASIDFGSVSSFFHETLRASSVQHTAFQLRCTPDLPLTVQLGAGAQPSGNIRRLQMGSTGHFIPYRICRDAGCSTLIPINGSYSLIATSANGGVIPLNFFADLTLPNSLPAGIYSDSVLVTLSW